MKTRTSHSTEPLENKISGISSGDNIPNKTPNSSQLNKTQILEISQKLKAKNINLSLQNSVEIKTSPLAGKVPVIQQLQQKKLLDARKRSREDSKE